MRDNLISREVVLKELREIMDEPHNTMFLMGIGAAISVIEHAETAFDKEKVIKKLKHLENDTFNYSNRYDDKIAFGESSAFRAAIEIVEKGGIE